MKYLPLALLLLAGCAPQFERHSYPVVFENGACTVVSADPNSRVNLSSMVCLDGKGQVLSSVGGMGKSKLEAATSILGPVVEGAAAGGITAAAQSAVRNGVKVMVQPVAP